MFSRKTREIIKKFTPNKILKIKGRINQISYRIEDLERNQKNLFIEKYSQLANKPKSEINSKEFKISSQNGEDGILLYIFSKIGIKNKTFVEFGVGDGRECNTANLIRNFEWNGLMIEGDKKFYHEAKKFYKPFPEVRVVNKFVTRDNINYILKKNGIKGEIDLLSVDIDGIDYHVWKAIDEISPRVVVIEYNAHLGTEKSLAVSYDENFERFSKHPSGLYYGASLKALTKLANLRGYILVGCDSAGINAFFVKKQLAKGKLKALTAEQAYYPKIMEKSKNLEKQFNVIMHLKFEEV